MERFLRQLRNPYTRTSDFQTGCAPGPEWETPLLARGMLPPARRPYGRYQPVAPLGSIKDYKKGYARSDAPARPRTSFSTSISTVIGIVLILVIFNVLILNFVSILAEAPHEV